MEGFQLEKSLLLTEMVCTLTRGASLRDRHSLGRFGALGLGQLVLRVLASVGIGPGQTG